MNKISALLIFLSSLSVFNAQETIPFRMTKYNNLIVKTQVNRKDSLDLMFQIAMEEASISPERIRSAGHIVFKEGISEGNTVSIGKNTYRDIRFLITSLPVMKPTERSEPEFSKEKFLRSIMTTAGFQYMKPCPT